MKKRFFIYFTLSKSPFHLSLIYIYYMAKSVSGQDKPNRALWLANRAGKIARGQDGATLPARDYPLYPARKISLKAI